jgi:DNA-binding CsgD family transcriptional regulator
MFYYTFPQMSIWKILKQLWMGSRQEKRKYSQTMGELIHLQTSNQPAGLLHDSHDARRRRWDKLSPREKDVTALACLRYTNPQIAARLGISAGTVKSYLERVLSKLGLQNKADLRVYFAAWDFSEFERRKDPHR